MSILKYFSIFMILMFSNTIANANGLESDHDLLWAEANTAYRNGQYDVAANKYHALLRQSSDDGQVYYNLGNSEMRLGHLAQAIAAYRAAKVRLPRDEDVAANLRLARARVKDAVQPPIPSTTRKTLFFWHYSLSINELITTIIIANAFFWFTLLALFLRRRRLITWYTITLAIILLTLVTSYIIRSSSPTTIAVVQLAKLDVYSGPNTNTVLRFRLHEGTEAIVTGAEEKWVCLELSDGKQGWVPSESVIKVVL
ncbi:MAG: tetratricopeptide repeat protein [Deltaproteobacteria bacterium]|nr:tetratricopeptide repeat protein [Deltaproteobacteria bacterium]